MVRLIVCRTSDHCACKDDAQQCDADCLLGHDAETDVWPSPLLLALWSTVNNEVSNATCLMSALEALNVRDGQMIVVQDCFLQNQI